MSSDRLQFQHCANHRFSIGAMSVIYRSQIGWFHTESSATLSVADSWLNHWQFCVFCRFGVGLARVTGVLDLSSPWTRKFCCTRWRHQMKTFSALLDLCAGNSPVIGEFPAQRPVTRSFDVFFDLRLNKRLSKQSISPWFETPSR